MAMMRTLCLWVAVLMLGGCASFHELREDADTTDYAPPELDYQESTTVAGGLYRGFGSSLINDNRAFRVGDILTVVLNESTQSSKSAGTSFGKESSIGIGVPNVFGRTYDRVGASAQGERDFSGSAKSSQQNTLLGSIAVTVHKVLPSGVLLVRGEKSLRLNQGDEFIRLSGLVRPDDINRFNQVSSQSIADARISYAGRGVLNDSNSAGWLTRFFTSPWFPL
jgi:flagellar L-ring protein precursor FlgH